MQVLTQELSQTADLGHRREFTEGEPGPTADHLPLTQHCCPRCSRERVLSLFSWGTDSKRDRGEGKQRKGTVSVYKEHKPERSEQ